MRRMNLSYNKEHVRVSVIKRCKINRENLHNSTLAHNSVYVNPGKSLTPEVKNKLLKTNSVSLILLATMDCCR